MMQTTTNLATGIAFLMTSMYGNVAPSATAPAASITAPVPQQASAVIALQDPTTVEQYLRTQYADTPILIDIARCESQFRQYDSNGNVLRGVVNNNDVGVMQINEKYHADEAKAQGDDLMTIEGNVAFAKYLYQTQGAAPWKASSPCWKNSGDLTVNK